MNQLCPCPAFSGRDLPGFSVSGCLAPTYGVSAGLLTGDNADVSAMESLGSLVADNLFAAPFSA